MNEIRINFNDMLYRVFRKWRVLIAAAAAGVLLLNGYAAVKLKQSIDEARADIERTEEETQTSREMNAESLASKLSLREKAEADRAVELYMAYQKKYNDISIYNTNSLKMQIDAMKAPNYRVQYNIDTHYETVYPVIGKKDITTALINSICAEFQSGKIYDDLAEAAAADIDSAYIPELFNVWQLGNDNLAINVTAPDEETCRKMMEVLKGEMESIQKDLKKTYGDFDCTLICEEYYEIVSSDLLAAQKSQIDNMNSIKNTCSGLANSLNDAQKKYYYAVLDKNESSGLLEEGYSSEDITEESYAIPEMKYFNLKYSLVGVLAGAMLAALIICFGYLFTSMLRVKNDMKDVFGIMLIGSAGSERKEKYSGIIDRRIRRLFCRECCDVTEEERLNMICAGISIAAQKSGASKVYITGTSKDRAAEELCRTIAERVSGGTGKSILSDPASLAAMADSDGVVIVEKTDASLYSDIKKEIEFCRFYNVRILGSVVIE